MNLIYELNKTILNPDLEYIPIASTVNSFASLFNKYVCGSFSPLNSTQHEFKYLQHKGFLRTIVLLVPVMGNLSVYLYDKYINYSISNITQQIEMNHFRSSWLQSLLGICEDRKFALELVKQDPEQIAIHANIFNDDKEIVLEAVSRIGSLLQFVSQRLKDDYEVVQAAILSNGMAIEQASLRLRSDKNLALLAINNNPMSINMLNPLLSNDQELVLLALRNNAWIHEDKIGTNLRNSPDFWKQVPQDKLAGQYVLRYCTNKQIACDLIKLNPLVYIHLSDLQNDRDVVIETISTDHHMFRMLPEQHYDDQEIVLLALQKNIKYGDLIGHSLKDSVEFWRQVSNDQATCSALIYCSNQAILLELLKDNPQLFQFINTHIKSDVDFILKALNTNIAVKECLTRKQKHNVRIAKLLASLI